jgi:hypothetical protein
MAHLDFDETQALGEAIHAAHLAGGTFPNVDKTSEIQFCRSFGSLGDIVRDGHCCTLDLINKGEITTTSEVGVYVDSEILSVLPDLHFLEVE